MQISPPVITIGFILGLILALLGVVFWAVGQLSPIGGGLTVLAGLGIMFR